MTMLQLIKEIFELKCRTRWLRLVDKEHRKYLRLYEKTKRQAFIVRRMMERYNELYEEDTK